MAFLPGTRCDRVQIAHFFRGQIGSWRSLGVGLVVGKRLRRLRHRCSSLEVSEPRPAQNLLKLLCLARDFGQECLKRRRMRCRRLRTSTTYPKRTPGDLRVANRQGSIDAAVMAGPSISRIKKKFFSPPSKCPIDLFGPVSNRTILKRLHVASREQSSWTGVRVTGARRLGVR